MNFVSLEDDVESMKNLLHQAILKQEQLFFAKCVFFIKATKNLQRKQLWAKKKDRAKLRGKREELNRILYLNYVETMYGYNPFKRLLRALDPTYTGIYSDKGLLKIIDGSQKWV